MLKSKRNCIIVAAILVFVLVFSVWLITLCHLLDKESEVRNNMCSDIPESTTYINWPSGMYELKSGEMVTFTVVTDKGYLEFEYLDHEIFKCHKINKISSNEYQITGCFITDVPVDIIYGFPEVSEVILFLTPEEVSL